MTYISHLTLTHLCTLVTSGHAGPVHFWRLSWDRSREIHPPLPAQWTHLFGACVNNLSWAWTRVGLSFSVCGARLRSPPPPLHFYRALPFSSTAFLSCSSLCFLTRTPPSTSVVWTAPLFGKHSALPCCRAAVLLPVTGEWVFLYVHTSLIILSSETDGAPTPLGKQSACEDELLASLVRGHGDSLADMIIWTVIGRSRSRPPTVTSAGSFSRLALPPATTRAPAPRAYGRISRSSTQKVWQEASERVKTRSDVTRLEKRRVESFKRSRRLSHGGRWCGSLDLGWVSGSYVSNKLGQHGARLSAPKNISLCPQYVGSLLGVHDVTIRLYVIRTNWVCRPQTWKQLQENELRFQ